jgi:hypothetical protein
MLTCQRPGFATPISNATHDWWYFHYDTDPLAWPSIEVLSTTLQPPEAKHFFSSGSLRRVEKHEKLIVRFRHPDNPSSDIAVCARTVFDTETEEVQSIIGVADSNKPLDEYLSHQSPRAFISRPASRFDPWPSYLQVSVSKESHEEGNIFAVKIIVSWSSLSSADPRINASFRRIGSEKLAAEKRTFGINLGLPFIARSLAALWTTLIALLLIILTISLIIFRLLQRAVARRWRLWVLTLRSNDIQVLDVLSSFILLVVFFNFCNRHWIIWILFLLNFPEISRDITRQIMFPHYRFCLYSSNRSWHSSHFT